MSEETKNPRGATLHMIDDARFTKLRRAFQRRGMGGLSLVAILRIVIDEWVRTENGKVKE